MARGPVGGVVVTVDARGGAVLLADGVDMLSVAERRDVGGADRLVIGVRGAAPLRTQPAGMGDRRETLYR